MRLIRYALIFAAIVVAVAGLVLIKWSPDPATQVMGLAVFFVGAVFAVLSTFIPSSHGYASGY